MIGDGALAFREFVVQEKLPLAAIQQALLELLRSRTDVVIFGAQAVNAYVDEPRMTQVLDLLSVRAADLAEELRQYLADRFHIAVRLRKAGLRGFRIFQVRQPSSRHLVDVRQVDSLPLSRRIGGLLVLEPPDLIAEKVIAYQRRTGQPKAGTDWRDLAMLLLTFPELKASTGPVRTALHARRADAAVLAAWDALVEQPIAAGDDEY